MARIYQLDSHVANLIAAGEVVERPASVVKELMENSIDAGAGIVTVEIKQGGMTYIRVTDDGCGISPEDAKTAFLRHATSKLRDARGLEAISTLGFRGEALAAIASVSRIEMLTRERGSGEGVSLALEAGDVVDMSPAGCPEGTTIIVRDLFYNTPARMKFMKSDRAEGSSVASAVLHCALSRPDVSVRFIKDGKTEFHTPGDSRRDSCIYSLFGREFAEGLITAEAADEDVAVEGFICTPNAARGNRSYQFFFVNDRSIRSKTLQAALEQAYANRIFSGRYPSCVLYITIKPGNVDVNVHPAKTEVKFVSDKQVFDGVYYAAKGALERHAEVRGTSEREAARRGDAGHGAAGQDAADQDAAGYGAAGQETAVQSTSAHGAAGQEAAAQSTSALSADRQETAVQPQIVSSSEYGSQTAEYAPERTLPSLPHIEPLHSHVDHTVDILHDSGSVTPFTKSDLAASENSQLSQTPPSSLSSLSSLSSQTPQPSQSSQTPQSSPSSLSSLSSVDNLQQSIDKSQFAAPFRMIGEALNTYIIVESKGSVWFIDKHAAHERSHFDALRAADFEPMSQMLITPIICRHGSEDAEILLENTDMLDKLGFTVESFGEDSVAVRRIPAEIDIADIEPALSEICGELKRGGTAEPVRRDNILRTVACKAAIKSGKSTTACELQELAARVMSGELTHCPHGRPLAFEITKSTLDRNFKRI